MLRNSRLRTALVLTFGIAAALGSSAPAHAEERKVPDLEETVRGMEPLDGVLRLYRQKQQRAFLEVPRREIGQPFILATSFSGGTMYAGWQWTELLVAWERLDDKLVLVERNSRYRADPSQPIEDVVRRTYSDRVLKALPILGESHDSSPDHGVLIDLKELFADGAPAFFGPIGASLDPALAKLVKLKAFPQNVEVEVSMPARADGQLTTLHYSLLKLPRSDYQPRQADDRVGYFLTAVKDFSGGPRDEDHFLRFVNRWDLRKADPSLAVSPPRKSIVFYIEKTVPIRFRRYVREGILEWNKAYEKIGFTDAVVVRQQTDDNEFASYDPEDARYNFFRWITSDRAFAMGPSRVNPLTGEILDADIIFDDSMVSSYLRDYHILLKDVPKTFFSPRLNKWYQEHPEFDMFSGLQMDANPLAVDDTRIAEAISYSPDAMRSFCSLGEGVSNEIALGALQAGAPAHGGEWPEEFIGPIVKEVVMHEIGHTLGLRHNFKASTWLSLAEIDQQKEGATVGSVMDYNPLNVAPDAKQGNVITTTIGPYDYWAIEYGYRPVEKPEELKAITARVAEKGLQYATDEDTYSGDPYVNRFDLGADPLAFARERVALTKRLMPTIVDRIVQPGEGYQRARRAFDMLLYNVSFAGSLAGRFVGGFEAHRDHRGDPSGRPPVVPVPVEKQREALRFVCDAIFSDSTFELTPELLRAMAAGRWTHWGSGDENAQVDYPILNRVLSVQLASLSMLLNPETLDRVEDQALKVGDKEDAITLPELLRTLDDAIFSEWSNLVPSKASGAHAMAISTVRMNLQRAYLGRLIQTALHGMGGPQLTRALAWMELKRLGAILDTAVKASKTQGLDAYTQAHIEESRQRIAKALEAGFKEE